MRNSKFGQSFVEYLILVGIILGVVVALAEGPLKNGVEAVFKESTEAVNVIAEKAAK